MTRMRGLGGGPSFTNDVPIRDALFVSLLVSPHPRARLLALDDSRASPLPGIVTVCSSLSAPEVFAGELRFRGDRVAACAAESAEAARRAIDALVPSYETLPPSDPALRGSARFEIGNADAAFGSCDDSVDVALEFASVPASALEPRGCWAWPDEDGRIVVRSPSESPYGSRREIAARLRWPEGILRIIQPRLGAGTGSGVGLQHEDLLAFLAKSTGRAVRLALRREDEITTGVHHPACHARLRGALRNARLVAVTGQFTFDAGYQGGPSTEELERSLADMVALWKLEAIDLHARTHVTNHPSTTPRTAPAMASAFGALLSAVARHTGRPTLPVLEELLVDPSVRPALALASAGCDGEKLPRPGGSGIGVACAARSGRGAASVSRHDDGSVSVSVPQTELGPGIERDVASLAAAALAVPAGRVIVGPSTLDTDVHALDCGGLAPAWAVARAVSAAARTVAAVQPPSRSIRSAESQQASSVTDPADVHAAVAFASLSLRADAASGLPRFDELLVVIDAPMPTRAETVAARLEGEALATLGSALASCETNSRRAVGSVSTLDAPRTRVLFARPPDGVHPFGDRSFGEAVAAAVLAAFEDACSSLGVEIERIPVHPSAFLHRED